MNDKENKEELENVEVSVEETPEVETEQVPEEQVTAETEENPTIEVEEKKKEEDELAEETEEIEELKEEVKEEQEEKEKEQEQEQVEEQELQKENVAQEPEEVEEEKQEEPSQDSEEYYDDINYQKKEDTEKLKKTTRGVVREIIDWVLCFVIAYVIYLNINYFFISAPGVRQKSMYPTVVSGERVLVTRPWLSGNKFNYGDIVTFEAPIDNKLYIDTEETFPTAQYENYTGLTLFLYEFMDVNKVNYIKRVIGMAGDHIEIKDGNVYRNGEKLEEDYIREPITSVQEPEYANVIVPEGTVYVMGDNREESSDSRTFGCVPIERVNGKVVCRIWPFNKIGAIK